MSHTPSKFQEAIYKEERETDNNILVNAVAGCLALDTPVLMFNGDIKKVQDIVVGDLLMGDDSNPRTVLKLCRGKEMMYEIIPEIGKGFICNKSHVLTVYVSDLRRLLDIKLNDYLTGYTEYRKQFIYYQRLKQEPVKFKVNKLEEDNYYGFTLDGNNRFLLGDFTITHNSGKTSSVIEIIKNQPQDINWIYLAFNRSIKEEIERKIGQTTNGDISTMHSLGQRSINNHFKHRIELADNKLWTIAFSLNKSWKIDKEEIVQTIQICRQLTDLYRNTMCNNISDLERVSKEIGIDYEEKHINYTLDILKEYRRQNLNPTVIDYPDMLYIPATNNQIRIVSKATLILVDEVQDLNNAQHRLVKKLKEQNNAKLIMVGDPFQAIYSFAGSNSDSFNVCKQYLHTKELPLSICYRCSKAILADANAVYPVLLPTDWAKEGIVDREAKIEDIQEDDMVICRNIKPLIELFFNLLLLHKRVTIKGKDLGKGILDLMKETKGKWSHEIQDELDKKLEQKANRLRERGMDKPHNHPGYVTLLEKVLVIQIIMIHHNKREDAIHFLSTVFSDDNRDNRGKVVLSTIHKAKGLEADNVYILDEHLIPSKYAITPEQLRQEQNLLYVARTRAKNKTGYLVSKDSEDKKKDGIINQLRATY